MGYLKKWWATKKKSFLEQKRIARNVIDSRYDPASCSWQKNERTVILGVLQHSSTQTIAKIFAGSTTTTRTSLYMDMLRSAKNNNNNGSNEF